MMRTVIALLCCSTGAIAFEDMAPREGWAVLPTSKSFSSLVEDTLGAVTDNGLAVVTQAGPTGAAKARGIDIPGNTVIGIFSNHFAVKILQLSTAAMIEAPIRLYVTENSDGTATLSYKLPSSILSSYSEATEDLSPIAAQLDERFAAVANAATN